jgi:hypothetical protein
MRDVCIYKHNHGLYSRVFSGPGQAWSGGCGEGCPYYYTYRPTDGDPCYNCKRPIRVANGAYSYALDWENYKGDEAVADIKARIIKAQERGWAIERIELTYLDIINVTCSHPNNVPEGDWLRMFGFRVRQGPTRQLVLGVKEE